MNKYLFFVKQLVVSSGRKAISFAADENECVVCGKVCGVIPVCKECKSSYFSVPEIDGTLCRCCGKQLISEKDVCMECREEVLLVHLDGVFPMFSYRLWNMGLLCRWKLEGERALSVLFSELMNERLIQLKRKYGDFVIVPVPPRPGKIREKGWDQVEEVCTFLEYRYGWNVRRILKRLSAVQQKSLDRNHRMEMIGKAYTVRDKVKSVPGLVCLVDDVLTTGSTLESCGRLLKDLGCELVIAVSLFIVDR